MKVYISAGWFNDKDFNMVEEMESLLTELGYDFHSPRLHTEQPGMVGEQTTFLQNIDAIKHCKVFLMPVGMMLDTGAIMELGAAYILGKFIIIYHVTNRDSMNLMLTVPSCHAYNEHDLKSLLQMARTAGSRGRRQARQLYEFNGESF